MLWVTTHSLHSVLAMTFEFDVTVRLLGDGLLGGIHEYDPYMGVHGTFGEYKLQRKVDLQLCGNQERPHLQNHQQKKQAELYEYDAAVLSYETREPLHFRLTYDEHTRGDDGLWFELWCHTRNSGLAEIDAKEARYTERHASCGIFALDMYTLLQTHKDGGAAKMAFTHSVVDDKIVQHKLQEYAQQGIHITEHNHREMTLRAMKETHKGVLHLEVQMRQFDAQLYPHTIFGQRNMKRDHLCALMPLNRKALVLANLRGGEPAVQHYAPVLYNSDKGVQCMQQALESQVLTPYARHFMQLERNGPAPLLKPLNPGISQLQMPMWVSKMGPVPAYAYWSCHDPTTREYPSEQARQRDLELYGFDARTETLLTRLLHSSLRRHGLSATTFEQEIREHFSPHNSALQATALFRLCEEVMADAGTFAANSANYTADFRFVNVSRGARKDSKMIVLDSWDNTILNNIGNSDDCEGEDNTASTIIRAYATGRHTLDFAWESPLLNACKLYLQHTVIYDVGGTVTSAYMDPEHKQIDMKKVKDLPMVGDSVDRASECGGHCHALMEPLSVALQRLRQGNAPADVLERISAQFRGLGADFMTRDATRSTLVLEPTSSIEPFILPLKETYGSAPDWFTKKKAVRQWHKQLRARMIARRDAHGKPLAGMADLSDMFGPEGLPYYVDEQHPQRRVSSFYNEPVHVISLELARFDPCLSQMAFCEKVRDQYHYGAKIADLLRDRTKHALVSPFTHNRKEWQQQVRPLVESLQHQLPIMAFGRYNDEQTALVCSRYNLPSELHVEHNFTAATAGTMQYEKLRVKSEADFDALVHTVAENPQLAMVRLYSRAWKFQQSEQQTLQLKQFIGESYGLVSHAFYTERHLPVCDPVVEILCVIDVQACLKIQDDGTVKK